MKLVLQEWRLWLEEAVVPSLDQSQEPRMHPWGQKAQLQPS